MNPHLVMGGCHWCNKPANLAPWSNDAGDSANLCAECLADAHREDDYMDRVESLADALELLENLLRNSLPDDPGKLLRIMAILGRKLDALRFKPCEHCGKAYSSEDMDWIDDELICHDCRKPGPANSLEFMPDTPVEF